MKISYKQIPANISKVEFGKYATTNYRAINTNFDKLSDLLQHNGAMVANVELTNGYRAKSNVIYPVTIEFLSLDIDETTLSIDEMHEILMDSDLNHILVATSKPDNAFKYRLFLQTTPITINSEYEYQQLFSNIPDFIPYDTKCIDIARCFYIYGDSAYTIKEYFKGNPLEIKGTYKKESNAFSTTSHSFKCRPTPLSVAKRCSNSNKGFKQYELTNLSFDLKNRKYLCARDKSWYSYELIRSNPVLLNAENIYKLLKALSNTYPDKIRLSPTEKLKYSIRLDEAICSGGFYFSNKTNCFMFNDLGTNENSCDIIDFCAKLAFGKTDKQSRDRVCAGLMKRFKISEINPYNKTIYPL